MEITAEQTTTPDSSICSTCHQPTLPQYYFCPNCGNKLIDTPLSTSIGTQIWIYAFSIILPSLCFLFITKWPGLKYSRSKDEKARFIGKIAWFLLMVSTVLTFWYAITITEKVMQSITNSINTELGGLDQLGY